jgi:hypothetical protein
MVIFQSKMLVYQRVSLMNGGKFTMSMAPPPHQASGVAHPVAPTLPLTEAKIVIQVVAELLEKCGDRNYFKARVTIWL